MYANSSKFMLTLVLPWRVGFSRGLVYPMEPNDFLPFTAGLDAGIVRVDLIRYAERVDEVYQSLVRVGLGWHWVVMYKQGIPGHKPLSFGIASC